VPRAVENTCDAVLSRQTPGSGSYSVSRCRCVTFVTRNDQLGPKGVTSGAGAARNGGGRDRWLGRGRTGNPTACGTRLLPAPSYYSVSNQ
jgi:hypothetical protein